MTDILPPPPVVDTPPQPPEPEAPESSRGFWWGTLGVVLAVGAVAGAGVLLGHQTPPATSTVEPGVCAGDWLEVRSTTFNGVALQVNIPGPDTITVDIWGSFDEHRRLVQQVTKNRDGANFMAWDFSYKIEAVEVSRKDGAYCFVSDDILAQLNTANGHPS